VYFKGQQRIRGVKLPAAAEGERFVTRENKKE
jgi:hypothetical protein